MINVIDQYFELSVFLGFYEPASFEEDLRDLCAAAEVFAHQMEVAHSNGIRAMAANLARSTAYFASPNSDVSIFFVLMRPSAVDLVKTNSHML